MRNHCHKTKIYAWINIRQTESKKCASKVQTNSVYEIDIMPNISVNID